MMKIRLRYRGDYMQKFTIYTVIRNDSKAVRDQAPLIVCEHQVHVYIPIQGCSLMHAVQSW